MSLATTGSTESCRLARYLLLCPEEGDPPNNPFPQWVPLIETNAIENMTLIHVVGQRVAKEQRMGLFIRVVFAPEVKQLRQAPPSDATASVYQYRGITVVTCTCHAKELQLSNEACAMRRKSTQELPCCVKHAHFVRGVLSAKGPDSSFGGGAGLNCLDVDHMEEEVHLKVQVEEERIGETHGKEQGEEQRVKERTTVQSWMTM